MKPVSPELRHERHWVSNDDGWELALERSYAPALRVPGRRPVLVVPGYGMNSAVFAFHPRGHSLTEYLALQGFDVFRVDLRGQGHSRRSGSTRVERHGLEQLADEDLGAALESVRALADEHSRRVDVVGASLGGTLMFLHAALRPDHAMGSLVAMGAPVRWIDIHPLVRSLFFSPDLIGRLSLRGSRRLAALALPALVRFAPGPLSIYLNPSLTDTRQVDALVRTVEDPVPEINRQIGHWIRARDLIVRGVNLSESLRTLDRPLLCIRAHGDGLVPAATASWPFHHVASVHKHLLVVGDAGAALAHADMFLADCAPSRVFAPLAQWLIEAQRVGG